MTLNTHTHAHAWLLLLQRDFVWKNPLQQLAQSRVFILPAQLMAGCFLCSRAQTSLWKRPLNISDVPITRGCVDRQKQFPFSQVSFLNPHPLTFE